MMPPNDDPDLIEETPPPEPTIYEGFQKIYAGLVEEITKECAMCCVETKQEKESYVAPKLFVDEAATEVQQIYFYAGTKPPSVEVLDAVDSSSVDPSEYCRSSRCCRFLVSRLEGLFDAGGSISCHH